MCKENHAHPHNHHHDFDAKDINATFYICLIINTVFVVVELLAGLIGNSLGLISDAGHNLTDILGIILALIAVKLIQKVDRKKSSSFITFCNAALLVAASVAIIYEGIEKLFETSEINSDLMMITAAIGIVVNGITAYLLMKKQKAEINVKVAYLHAAGDALVSVGVVISGFMIKITGLTILDAIISIAIGLIILIASLKIFINCTKKNNDGRRLSQKQKCENHCVEAVNLEIRK